MGTNNLPEADDFAARLEQAKLDAMKELAYGASHEINNPLANIAARAQTLLRDESHPERRRALESIHQQALRAHEMISDLMLFARPPALVCAPFDAGVFVEEVAASCRKEASRRQIELALRLPDETIELYADRQQLFVALKALIVNSLEAIGERGTIQLTLAACGLANIEFHCQDDGPGISATIREHLFDPFYSGREAGRGLGFGLSKCWRIITDHGGTLKVVSASEQGAHFTVRLPLAIPQP
jgi:hypothetical protein